LVCIRLNNLTLFLSFFQLVILPFFFFNCTVLRLIDSCGFYATKLKTFFSPKKHAYEKKKRKAKENLKAISTTILLS